ncbi:MAG: anti-sigma factor, partial [bacterium]
AGLLVADRYESRLARLAGEIGSLRGEREQLEALLREREGAQALLDLLRDPATRLVTLQGAGSNPEAVGRIVWHETTGGWIMVAKLPPTRPGTTYELWTITGGRPSPAGLFDVDASGVATHRIDPAGGPVDTFAVTLEPAGGVPAPTGPIVLAAR